METKLNTLMEMEVMYMPGKAICTSPKITSSLHAYEILKQVFNPNTIACQEEFIVLYLNNTNIPLGTYKAALGGITGTVADVRLILGTALKALATGMIIAHNHPSGSLKPSDQDKSLTKKLKEACSIMDIALLDHIIVSPYKGYLSFADEGLM